MRKTAVTSPKSADADRKNRVTARRSLFCGCSGMSFRKMRRNSIADVPAVQSSQRGRGEWLCFNLYLHALTTHCQPRLPVIVRVRRVRGGIKGSCCRDRKHFIIDISSKLTEEEAIETLQHEWAHTLDWTREHDRLARSTKVTQAQVDIATHGPDWGVAYSLTYRVILQAREDYIRQQRRITGGRG